MLTDLISIDRLKSALSMRKRGVKDADLYKILWPEGRAPVPLETFAAMMAAESIADEECLPTVELTGDAASAMAALRAQRELLSERLCDEEGHLDMVANTALIRNAEATVKLLRERRDAEVHEINRREMERERRPKGSTWTIPGRQKSS